jgi:hypothetical protein
MNRHPDWTENEAMSKRNLDSFMNQQIHVTGSGNLASPERGIVGPAIVDLRAGDCTIEMHLHQTSKVHELHLCADTKTIQINHLDVSVFHPDRNNDSLQHLGKVKVGTEGYSVALHGVVTPIVRVKLSVSKPGKLHLSLSADTHYMNGLAQRIRVSRHVAALSDSNSERRDKQCDSKYIQHGQLFESLANLPAMPVTLRERALFPPVQPRDKNILGEAIENGSTILIPLMNRNANVEKNLACWANAGFDEVVLMDWASTIPVSSLPIVQKTKNVRVIRVDGPQRYIRTWAMNLANRCVRHSKVFKCDSDVEVSPNFLKFHHLRPGVFIVGDWRHARDFNERHLHGDVYYNLVDFDRVNGFDERIINYGQEDTNLTDRMLLAGLQKQVLSYDTLRHQEHDNSQRGSNQNVVHPIVNTHYYRSLCNFRPMWSRHVKSPLKARLELDTPREIRFIVDDTYEETEDSAALNSAIDMVASWYGTVQQLANMRQEEKLALIWQRSIE